MPTGVSEYIIVNGNSDTALIAVVNKYIKQGWRPIGGPVPTTNLDQMGVLLQALVR
jgi:hypothetical protein